MLGIGITIMQSCVTIVCKQDIIVPLEAAVVSSPMIQLSLDRPAHLRARSKGILRVRVSMVPALTYSVYVEKDNGGQRVEQLRWGSIKKSPFAVHAGPRSNLDHIGRSSVCSVLRRAHYHEFQN